MSFKYFKFHPKLNAGIAVCGYPGPTPIQKEAIPPILAGRDKSRRNGACSFDFGISKTITYFVWTPRLPAEGSNDSSAL